MFQKYIAILLTTVTGAAGFGMHSLMVSENHFVLSFDEPIEIPKIMSAEEAETNDPQVSETNDDQVVAATPAESNEQQSVAIDTNAAVQETIEELEAQEKEKKQELETFRKSYKQLLKDAIENIVNLGDKGYIRIDSEDSEEQKWLGNKINFDTSNKWNISHAEKEFETKYVPSTTVNVFVDYQIYISSIFTVSKHEEKEDFVNGFQISWKRDQTEGFYHEDWFFIDKQGSDKTKQLESEIKELLNNLSSTSKKYFEITQKICKQQNVDDSTKMTKCQKEKNIFIKGIHA